MFIEIKDVLINSDDLISIRKADSKKIGFIYKTINKASDEFIYETEEERNKVYEEIKTLLKTGGNNGNNSNNCCNRICDNHSIHNRVKKRTKNRK